MRELTIAVAVHAYFAHLTEFFIYVQDRSHAVGRYETGDAAAGDCYPQRLGPGILQ